MKICVCSDSHGNPEGLARMISSEKPDAILYLGDGMRDWQRVTVPEGVFFAAVAGNCDLLYDGPPFLETPFRVVELLGRRFYLCHGHQEQVKLGFDGIRKAVERNGCDIGLYGHTHMADANVLDGRLYLNPGALRDRENRYAVLWAEEGELKYTFKMVAW